jgi:actin related protein 2/3 complex subunit 2
VAADAAGKKGEGVVVAAGAAAKKRGGATMLILDVESAILRNLLERSLDENETISDEYIFCDFDGVRYHVKILKAPGGDKKSKKGGPILVEIRLSCAAEIAEYGGNDVFEKLYGKYKVEPSANKGITFTHAIQIDLNGLEEAEQENLITLAARLKANLLGSPIIWAAEQFANKSNFAPFEVPYRGSTGESYFVTPNDQGASVTFRIRFGDKGDKVIAGVFFQELGSDAVRRKIAGSPVFRFSDEPPGELQQFSALQGDKALFSYVTIVLQQRQLSETKRIETADLVPLFRNYIHYHIKCAKAFLHLKMRARAADLLTKLASATPEPKQKVRRGASGKPLK